MKKELTVLEAIELLFSETRAKRKKCSTVYFADVPDAPSATLVGVVVDASRPFLMVVKNENESERITANRCYVEVKAKK